MTSGDAPAPEPGPVLVVDADAERGARTADLLASCGFPARAAGSLDEAREHRASILVIEDAALPRPERRAGAATAPERADDLVARARSACGAAVVISWRAAGAAPGAGPPPGWADAEAGGADALVGKVALHASGSIRDLAGEIARLREAISQARGAAHEMSQPLTTILARSQLLLEKTPADDPRHRPLEIIAREAERLTRTVESFREILPSSRR